MLSIILKLFSEILTKQAHTKLSLKFCDKVKKVNQFHYRSEVPRGFQEVKVPRLRDNAPMVVRLSALCTGRFYPQEILLVLVSVRG